VCSVSGMALPLVDLFILIAWKQSDILILLCVRISRSGVTPLVVACYGSSGSVYACKYEHDQGLESLH